MDNSISARDMALTMSANVIRGFDAVINDPHNVGLGKKGFLQFGDLTGQIPIIVRGVHLYNDKKKFDLELVVFKGDGWHATRIYNVDSDYVII